ncbi:MAG: hypothetical protein ACQESD_06285 [Thermoplasmatota archaeon]
MFDYRLSKKEISLLLKICRNEQGIRSLANLTSLSYSRTSELLSRLENKGFIIKSNTLKKKIAISDREHTQRFCDLVKIKQHIDWEHILSDSKIKILTQLCYMPNSIKNLSHLTSKTEKTIRYSLEKPREIGIITEKNKITDRFEPLCSFLESWRRYHNIKYMKETSPNQTFLWQGGLEFIVETENPIDHRELQETGPSKLGEELYYTDYMYIYSNREQGKYEHILNALTVRPGDRRVLKAVERRIKREDMSLQELIKQAERYRKEIDTEELEEMIG